MIGVLSHYRRHAPIEMGGTATGDGLFWRDPEEFLDAIESAVAGSVASEELLRTDTGKISTEVLVDMGRRALAIECSHFLRGANLESERWLPYRRWASKLGRTDTVVTFNYDLIPERLSAAKDRHPDANLRVVVPDGCGGDVHDTISEIRKKSGTPVLKLHGSVNWLAKDGMIKAVEESDTLPVTCSKGSDLVLAVPGPGKVGLRDEFKPMATLWTAGMRAVRAASRVIFVGYRFPPTDAQARIEILECLDPADGPMKSVEVVLGPNTNHEDVVRVRALLGFKLPAEMIKVLPLLAEDFLAL